MSKNTELDIGSFNIAEEDIDPETGRFLGDNNKIKLENTKDFKLLLIKANNIEKMNWIDPNYLTDILNSDFVETVTFSPNNFAENLGTALEVEKYELPDVKCTLFYEETNYHYEILYIDLLPDYKKVEIENQFSLLLQNNGDEKIFGNALIMKTYVPISDMEKMEISDIFPEDIKRILEDRINTSVITFDNGDYEEKKLIGPMEQFAESFFDEEDKYKIQKMELAFLRHNVNIWFTKFDYGFDNVCGNLLKHLVINKCIIFTLVNDNVRGNLSMDEFNKIKFLSEKIENYKVPEELDNEDKDDIGRLIIKNKYRILEYMYNKYK
jgi:hypothetical protein